jgi:hypothetical protein
MWKTVNNFRDVEISVLDGSGFRISYNPAAIASFLDATETVEETALIIYRDTKSPLFYILNGDHREAFEPLISKGLDACLTYFNSKPDQHSSWTTPEDLD